ncbi:P-loop NTPase fold protein [Roseibium sp. MMSF_3544]|uniref:P-loop NTPase fold protein n=1 Tax=unclassified Roseibium TaxID=2629323 RepID=UPI00273DC1B0|nr:P-loop NTPase fold protein [Roseibium sp. MMSF_3544]
MDKKQSSTARKIEGRTIWDWLVDPLVRAAVAGVLAVVFFAVAYYGFSVSKPSGSPFWDTSTSVLPPVFTRDHEPAYAGHEYRPVGPRDQFFFKERLSKWSSVDQPVKGLLRAPGNSPWRIDRSADDRPDAIVTRLFLSNDRTQLGAISVDGEVHFYQNESWQLQETRVRGGAESLRSSAQIAGDLLGASYAVFSPDGSRIVTTSSDGTNRIWDSVTGEELAILSQDTGTTAPPYYSEDGLLLLGTSENGTVLLWDGVTGQLVKEIQNEQGRMLDARFVPNSSMIAIAFDDATIQFIDRETEQLNTVFKGDYGNVLGLEFSNDGSRLLSLTEFGIAQVWDVAAESWLLVAEEPKQPIRLAALSGDGSTLITVTEAGTVSSWNVDAGDQQSPTIGNRDIRQILFAPDGERFLTLSANGSLLLHRLGASEIEPRGLSSDARIIAAAFSPDASQVAALHQSGLIEIRDTNTWEQLTSNPDDAQSPTAQQTQELFEAWGVGPVVSDSGLIKGRLSFSGDGSRLMAVPSVGFTNIYEIQYANDQSVRPTALDARSRLIFGEERIQWFEGTTRRNVPSSFLHPIHAVAEVGRNGDRVAVGGAGAIYVGIPVNAEYAPDLPDAGELGGFDWYVAVAPSTADIAPSLLAVDFDGDTGVAVGEAGTVMVSHDSGTTWTAAAIENTHAPRLTDVRVDRGKNYAVAVGRPAFEGAPSHALLYKTKSLPQRGENGVGDWSHIQWEAGAPVFSYVAIVLGLCALLAAIYFLRLWWLIKNSDERPVAAGKSDREIGWDDEDALGLKQLATQVSLFLRNAQTEPPLVMGVAGGWGSGKSSLMNLLCQDLKRRGTSAVWFNAWHHQNEDHLLAALFEAVRSRAIPSIWTWRGLLFRARLVAPRLWAQLKSLFPIILLIMLAVVLAALAITDPQIAWLHEQYEAFLKTISEEEGVSLTGIAVKAIPAIGLFLWLRSLWIALPAKPVKLLRDFASFTRLTDFQDKLSFRYNFGKAFGEVCTALRMPGVPGLVIFIDDLDRCQAKSVLSIFEAVNYFVSVGDCIVVMGFDRAQVEHSIGDELKDIADGIPDREIPFNFGKSETDKRRAYARHYMEKLINLEIAIPPMTPEAAAALAESRKEQRSEPLDEDKKWLNVLKPRVTFALQNLSRLAQIVVLAALGWSFWLYGGSLYDKVTSLTPTLTAQDTPAVSGGAGGTSSGTGSTTAPQNQGPEAAPLTPVPVPANDGVGSENPVLDDPEPAPTPIDPMWNYQELWILVPFVLGLALFALWIYLRRAYEISKNVEYDPSTFVDALKDANQVIEGINGTPRAVKRFMNRMRFASARMRQINYRVDFLDLIAQRLGLVSYQFEAGAESAPKMNDKKVVALGSAEAFLQGLPEPDDAGGGLGPLVDAHLKKMDAGEEIAKVANRVKNLIGEANVNKDDLRNYAETLHSSALLDQSDQGVATGENAQKSGTATLPNQAAE